MPHQRKQKNQAHIESMRSDDWRRKAEVMSKRIAELEERNRDLMGMVENSFDGLAIIDKETRLLLLNPAFYKIMGFETIPCIGRTTKEIVGEGHCDNAASMKVVETGKAETVMIRTAAGRQVLSTGIPVFDVEGNIERIYCNLRDITELNSLKEKYEHTERLASRYLIELQEAKRSSLHYQVIARSQRMKQILDTTYRIARVDATVLILGESGVGKDLIARIIHEASPRKEAGTFVKINCAAIPAELLESELFGYETGAFTGASKEGKAGYFEIADKGTLFLDEVGDLPLKLQVKLLSVLQDQEVTRIGGTKPKKIDTRIIAATNQNLEEMMRAGKFREDLYYRLSVVPISIPAVRERKEEVPFLLLYYLERYNKKYKRNCKLSKELVDVLSAYKWPGNVRELANLVEHLMVVVQEEILRPEHLPEKYLSASNGAYLELSQLTSLKSALRELEAKLIRAAVSQFSTMEEAALKLGVSMATLTRKKKTLFLSRPRAKRSIAASK